MMVRSSVTFLTPTGLPDLSVDRTDPLSRTHTLFGRSFDELCEAPDMLKSSHKAAAQLQRNSSSAWTKLLNAVRDPSPGTLRSVLAKAILAASSGSCSGSCAGLRGFWTGRTMLELLRASELGWTGAVSAYPDLGLLSSSAAAICVIGK